MAVTNYYTVNGEIIGEKTAGGTRVDYLTDALGSVTATVNNSAQVVNTYRYKPYGNLLAKTGSGADPAFGWVGSQGYRPTQRKFSDFYMMFRHYADEPSRWTAVDPIGKVDADQGQYTYASNNPVLRSDPLGLIGIIAYPPRLGAGQCGGQIFEVTWQVPAGFTGYVVQHVVFHYSVTDCAGRPFPIPNQEYWERWIVVNGRVYGSNRRLGSWSNNISDTFETADQGPNTRGCETVHGSAKMFRAGTLPHGLGWINPPPQNSPSGDLPIITGPTPGFPGWSDRGGVLHWLKSCWNCCNPGTPWAPVPKPCQTAFKP